MCSIIGGSDPFKIRPTKSNTHNLTTTASNTDDWCATFSLFTRLIAYTSILAVIALVIFLVLKYVTDLDDENTLLDIEEEARGSEANPLRAAGNKAMEFSYGTCSNTDSEESGYCSSSTSSSNFSTELYDGKVCVICYDEERNCFFVPCGHCATCYVCARRIFDGENKVCPVCRRFIGKVRKLFAL